MTLDIWKLFILFVFSINFVWCDKNLFGVKSSTITNKGVSKNFVFYNRETNNSTRIKKSVASNFVEILDQEKKDEHQRYKRTSGEFQINNNLSKGRQRGTENDYTDLVGRVGETQIRHGRSRNHFARYSRDKKNNNLLTSLEFNERFLNGAQIGDVLGAEFSNEPLETETKNEKPNSNYSMDGNIFKQNVPSPSPEPQSIRGIDKENKYDLRSFFGLTTDPTQTDAPETYPTTAGPTQKPHLNFDYLSKPNFEIREDDKSVDSQSIKFMEVTTVPDVETTISKKYEYDKGKDDNKNTILATNGNADKQAPETSLESVHSFINYKNRSKKKEEVANIETEAETRKPINIEEEIDNIVYPDEEPLGEIAEDGNIRIQGHADIVTRFLRIVESQHLLGENCTAGTDLNLGEGVVDRYAQERFRVEADVAVNRANMLTRLWKYAGPEVMYSEYLLHASVFSMVEFDDDIFAAGNCYDQYQYKDYQLFCPFAYRLPEGPILVKDLAVEYKYLSNTSEWFYIARKNAENVIRNYNQFSRGFNTYTYNESAHTDRVSDEILSVTYDDGKWSKPYYDCGGGNIWMLTYTVPFFGYANGTYFFKGTSGIDIDLRRVDIDQCPLKEESTQLNIFAATDKCKKRTTECIPLPGLGFRRGSYKCVCKRGFYFPEVTAEHRFYNGTVIEEEYEKLMMGEQNRYSDLGFFECLQCAEGCEACIDNSPCVVSLNWLMRTAILVLDCVVICCLPFVVFFTWKYGNVKVVRAASPVLLRVIALGALFIYCTNIVMYPRPTIYTCTARVWLREIGFCLTYGALMLKTWRISVIFRVRSAKAVKITDFNLLKRLGVIVAVFSVFLVIRTLVAPPIVIVGRTATDLKAYLCKTDWWDHSFTTMEVIFLIWGIRLCIVVRKAPSEFNESRFISMAIYNEFLLSVFLNISMFFLQSPANPDLLYIIFFCHTQLTITLLLCFIFGSKAYMVFKGHGKGDHEGSSMVAKTPGAKFINKSRSAVNSQYATSTNSSAGHGEYAKVTEQDIQEEFKRLYAQLEILKDKNLRFGNRHLTAKISAMQEAAARQDSIGKSLKEEKEPNDDKKKKNDNSRFNNVFSAMADKLTCAQAITPGEESTSSGREYITEICESSVHTVKSKNRNVTFSPVKNGGTSGDVTTISENDNTNKKSIEDISNLKSPKSRLKGKSSPAKHSKHEDSNKGCDKCLSTKIETDNDELEKNSDRSIDPGESDSSGLPKSGQSPEGENGSPNHTPGKSNKNQIKSGHARTHAIVINLDDKSRFTEEVTV